MSEWLILLGLLAPDMTGAVAVEAAYAIHTTEEMVPQKKCCGQCTNGKITHGDGHTTDCPCPSDCPCKNAKESQPICKPLKK